MAVRGGGSRNACWVLSCMLIIGGALFLGQVRCDDDDDDDSGGQKLDGASLPLLTDLIYSRLSNLNSVFTPDIKRKLGFCIKDVDKEWNGAFNFTGKLDFFSNCVKKTKGDITRRVCTAAEINFYFNNFFQQGSSINNYLKPNKNCNLTSWAPGCEPGWGCSVAKEDKIDIRDLKNMPLRIQDCQPCCEGFFCPQGITCMIRKYMTIPLRFLPAYLGYHCRCNNAQRKS